HLVRTPAVFGHAAIDLARSSPAFRRLQNQSRPARALTQTVRARIVLNRANALDDTVERARHAEMRLLVARLRVHEIGFVAVPAQQLRELFAWDARQDGRPGDLVPVQVQD